MSIEQVWKKYNVSTVMVLPLFWDITRNIFARGTTTVYPFPQLCLEYGLINTFLLKDGKYDGCLHLLFDNDYFIQDLDLTTSIYFSMCELLVDCDYFRDINVINEGILISLKIPGRFRKDITENILEGKYSKLSDDYKREIKIKEHSIPIGDNKLAIYMSTNDLAYAVAIRAKHIKEEIEKVLDMEISVKDEFYEKFNEDKETINILK